VGQRRCGVFAGMRASCRPAILSAFQVGSFWFWPSHIIQVSFLSILEVSRPVLKFSQTIMSCSSEEHYWHGSQIPPKQPLFPNRYAISLHICLTVNPRRYPIEDFGFQQFAAAGNPAAICLGDYFAKTGAYLVSVSCPGSYRSHARK